MSEFGWLILLNAGWMFSIFDLLKRFEKYYVKYYQFSLFDGGKSKFDKLILSMFSERKGKYCKFVFYMLRYEKILAIVQLLILVGIYITKLYLNHAFGVGYLISLLIFSCWPMLVINVFRVAYHWRDRKSERNAAPSEEKSIMSKGLRYKKLLQKKFAISDAIDEYISVENPKKKKYYITPENIEKVKSLLEKKFPYACTREWKDTQGTEIFEVYFEQKGEKISVVNIPIHTEKNR